MMGEDMSISALDDLKCDEETWARIMADKKARKEAWEARQAKKKQNPTRESDNEILHED